MADAPRDLHTEVAVQAETLEAVQKDISEIKETLRIFQDSTDRKFWRLTLVIVVSYLIPIALFFVQRLVP